MLDLNAMKVRAERALTWTAEQLEGFAWDRPVGKEMVGGMDGVVIDCTDLGENTVLFYASAREDVLALIAEVKRIQGDAAQRREVANVIQLARDHREVCAERDGLKAGVERLTQERNDAESRCADAASELREERRRHQESAVERDDSANQATRRLARIGHWLRSYDLAMAMGRAACERIAELEGQVHLFGSHYEGAEIERADLERRTGETALVEFARRQEIVRDRDQWRDRALLAEGRLRHPKL